MSENSCASERCIHALCRCYCLCFHLLHDCKISLQTHTCLKILWLDVGISKAGDGLITRACSYRTRGNGFKLKEGTFTLDIRKKFSTVRVMRHLNRLPREAVAAPSLARFKARLDGALSNLGWWKGSLPMGRGVGTS